MIQRSRVIPSRHILQLAVAIAVAFSVGSAMAVAAGPVVSGFVGLMDGNNTAAINATRELSVTDAAARTELGAINAQTGRLSFDANGNLKTAPQGTSTSNAVDVTDRAARQLGHVTVDNLATTQAVSGTVTVGNFPSTQNVAGAVSVSGLPATTELFHTASFITVSAGELKALATIDVSHVEKLRVAAFAVSGTTAHFAFSMVSSDNQLVALLDQFDVAPGAIVVRTEEMPGRTLVLFVDQRSGGSTQVQLTVWGR